MFERLMSSPRFQSSFPPVICWSRWDSFEFDLKICEEDQIAYTLMFSVFLLKPHGTLESLSISMNPSFTSVRFSWHKNWQQTCCQEGTRPCWKVKNTKNSDVISNFSSWISFEHNVPLQITKTIIILVLLWNIFILFYSLQIFGFNNFLSVSISKFG